MSAQFYEKLLVEPDYHAQDCPAIYRPTVAAALRKRDERYLEVLTKGETELKARRELIEQLSARHEFSPDERFDCYLCGQGPEQHNRDIIVLEAELAALRAKVEELATEINILNARIVTLTANCSHELDAVAAAQRENQKAIDLIIEHGGIAGEHHGLLDYLRNLLQVTVTNRDNAREALAQLEVAQQENRAQSRK